MGVDWNTFWTLNPKKLLLISKGHKKRLMQQDQINWLNGQYMVSAVGVAVEHVLAGRKAVSKYIEKPILLQMDEEEQKKEKMKEVNLFFEKLKVMQENFELAKKEKDGMGS